MKDRWLALLAALAAVQYAALSPLLLGYDLALTYPFRGGDSFDWLLDGLALAGEDVRYSFRPPGLPLVLAALHRLSVLSVFPLLTLGLHHAAAVATHLFLRRRYGGRVAFVCGLALLTNATVLSMALEVMADLPAAILLGAACAAFLLAGERPALYPVAGLLAGLSAVTQQAALLLPLPAAITLLLGRRHHLRRASPWLGAGAFVLFPAAWLLAKKITAGVFTDVVTVHWALLGFQPDNAVYYLLAAPSFWGWPALLLVAAGAVFELARRSREADTATPQGIRGDTAWRLFPLLVTATLLLFFALGYAWLAKRFLIYAFVPSLALLGAALHRLRGSRAFWPVALLALLIGAWPLPRPVLAGRSVLWPVPALYAVIPAANTWDSSSDRLAGARIEREPMRRVARWSTWGRVIRENRRAGGRTGGRAGDRARIDPRALEGVEIAVLVVGDEGRSHPIRPTVGRLGYLLRRKVVHVPDDLYPDDWWGWRGLEPVGVVDRFRLFRSDLPILGRTAVVCFDRGDPRGRDVGRRARRGEGLEPPPPRDRLEQWVALARQVDALHGRHRGLLVVLPEARGAWTRLLPFVSSSQDVRLPRRGEGPSPADLADLEVEGVTHLGPVTAWHLEGPLRPLTVVGTRDGSNPPHGRP